VTDAHFDRAVHFDHAASAAQNPAQQLHVTVSNDLQAEIGVEMQVVTSQSLATDCENLQEVKVGDTGLEQSSGSSIKPHFPGQHGTESGTVGEAPMPASITSADLPPDLAEILKVWPSLPPAIRAGILAMVRAAMGP